MSRMNQILDTYQHSVDVAFLSSYIPRKCGIATFTKDLTKAINDLNPERTVRIVAMGNGEPYTYPSEVLLDLEKDALEDYERAVQRINASEIEILCVQHEYGLYGGETGDALIKLLESIRQPLVTTLHTILQYPTEKQREVVLRLSELSEAVVAMIPDAKERLVNAYGVDPDKVVIIHHGVPDQPRAMKVGKALFGWEDRRVLLMTGLLNKDKGIDYVLDGLVDIIKTHPETLFAIVGQTHPEVIKKEGEVYREFLIGKVAQLGLEGHVEFINEYLPLDQLLKYYEAADIYLTPHLNPEQITSGTLAYALGMGKACVSTPYVYAKAMLADERGVLVAFKESAELSAAVLHLLGNAEFLAKIEARAYELGRRMSWSHVAERYLILFRLIRKLHNIPDRPM
jgi:glycosyltransferase involved in cell wall biosynthesis